MHMPADPINATILARRASAHQQLWHVLAAESWPIPLALLPPGTALVGGAVRDGLIGRLGERPDLDLVVPTDGLGLARVLAQKLGGTAVELDQERSIGRLVLKGWTIDLARQDGTSLAADLRRRDYTVNAMALRLPIGEERLALIDPLDGLADLMNQQLRATAEANLLADPLRLLRGLRFAAELGFTLSEQTWEWILRHRASLAVVAGERILAELERLVCAADATRGVELLQRSGLLDAWKPRPEADRPAAATAHLTPEQAQLRGLSEEEIREALPIARLAALLDEASLQALHASNRLRRRCRHLRRWRQRLTTQRAAQLLGAVPHGFEALPEAEQLELHRQLDGDLPALLLELAPPAAKAALLRWRDPGDPLFHPQAPLDGLKLQQQLGLSPGRRLGLLLEHLTTERAFGRLPRVDPSNQESLTAARLWLQSTGDPRHD
jgi:tRNA nucleotidyltransferase (CCA-adding enzyme)